MPNNIYNLSLDELRVWVKSNGEPEYRGTQLWEGLYQHLWNSPNQFSNLPKQLRENLIDNFTFTVNNADEQSTFSNVKPVKFLESKDHQTVKTLFSLPDGRQVEAVLMHYDKRRTLCISTQAGCAMGCVFCATGQMGYKRNLSRGEIIEQVLYYARQLATSNEHVTNVVLMGMGEPFHNYEETMAAIHTLNDPFGCKLGERRFTISTVGLVPGIRRFTSEHSQVNLAISLHAADDSLRSQLLPINKKYPLDSLLEACLEYVQQTHRRISFEWALIQGVNDTLEQAHLLAGRLKQFQTNNAALCHVNLIPLNPTEKFTGRATTHQNAILFQNILEKSGIPCTIRLRRGIEIQAGCGQLASKKD